MAFDFLSRRRRSAQAAKTNSHEPPAWSGLEALEPRVMLAGDFNVALNPIFASNNPNAPEITGTCQDLDAVVEVTIDGVTRIATRVDGDPEVWFVQEGQYGPLAEGVYDVQVFAHNDAEGTSATDDTTDELTIDLTPPTVALNSLVTADTRPFVSGTSEGADIVLLWLNFPNEEQGDNSYIMPIDEDGNWGLELPSPSFADLNKRSYTVTVNARDIAENFVRIDVIGGLRITGIDLEVTVDPLNTNSVSPELTGTVNDVEAQIFVTVNGVEYEAINNNNPDPLMGDPRGGPGTWTLPAGTIAPLADGTYDVSVRATQGGDEATDDTVDELIVETAPPVVAFDASVSDVKEEGSFALTGTVDDPDATVIVMIQYDLTEYVATNNGDGTWELAIGAWPAQLDGVYDILVRATDIYGNVGQELLVDGLTVDLVPGVTIDTLVTGMPSPELTGTIDDPNATIQVTVNGRTYDAVNDGLAIHGAPGTWTLAAGTIEDLPEGTYEVVVRATDAGGKIGTDTSSNELTIGLAVTVDTLLTNDTRPALTGTVNDPDAEISLELNGRTYTSDAGQITIDAEGNWELLNNAIPPAQALADGTYDVQVTATNVNTDATDTTTDELTIDATNPSITVFSVTTLETSPEITGTAGDAGSDIDMIEVVVSQDGVVYGTYTWVRDAADNEIEYSGNFGATWTLPAGTLPDLAPGTYQVIATATDGAGNTRTDGTSDELEVQFEVTIDEDTLTTNDRTPTLTGTVADLTTNLVVVTIDGVEYEATSIIGGVWTMDGAVFAGALSEGEHEVTVRATSPTAAGEAAGTLTIDLVAPTVTVDELTTNDPTPELTGTVDDVDAYIELTVGGLTFNSDDHILINADGTWTLLDESWDEPEFAGAELALGTYDVAVMATDEAGNTGNDETTDELVVTDAPIVDELVTNDTTPELTGTVWDVAGVTEIVVVINGETFTLGGSQVTLDLDTGVWTLPDDLLSELVEGIYDVSVTVTNGGADFADLTTDELTIDLTAPTVTVDALDTTYRRPELTGTVSEPENIATLSVQAVGNVSSGVFDLTNGLELDRATGVWRLPFETIQTTLSANAAYDVQVTAVDEAGNVGTDETDDELSIYPQTTISVGSGGVRTAWFVDPDGTIVKINIRNNILGPQITFTFDSNSRIELPSTAWWKVVLRADAGVTMAAMNVVRDTPTLVIQTHGGTTPGTTLGLIQGAAELRSINARTVDLVGVNGTAISMSGVIDSIQLRSITGDVLMSSTPSRDIAITVGDAVTDSNIVLPNASIRYFSAGKMINSALLVGVVGAVDDDGDGVADLPTTLQIKEGYRIGRLNVRGIRGDDGFNFVNSNIAADFIGGASINQAKLDNDNLAFGVTANRLRGLRLRQWTVEKRYSLSYPRKWDDVVDVMDLTVRLPDVV